jgi:hypothetical protein
MAVKSTGRFTPELRGLMRESYDQCRSCGSKLPKEIAAFAGYDKVGAPLYVGECCKHHIDELATHVYWWWELDKRCAPDEQLWRYMDFAKFVSILEQRGIYFARADFLGDAFEGAAGIAERREAWDKFYLDFFQNAVRTAPNRTVQLSTEEIDREATSLLEQFSFMGEHQRTRSFVSCWHSNTGESEALWRLYCPPQTMGVAIKTTAELLTAALTEETGFKIGHVQYVDFRKAFAGIHDRIFWKRQSLSHEAEVRAVIERHRARDQMGITVSVDLEHLLLAIVPSPFAPSWFAALVESTMRRFGIEANVTKSELLSTPFF